MFPNILYDYAISFIGVPYKWGGSNPITGFDCSGFIQELLASVGLDPAGDQSAQSLYDHFSNKGLQNIKELGSLVFYGKDLKNITHITMMLDPYRCIGANSGDSSTVNAQEAAKRNAFIKVRPYNYRSDVVAIIRPFLVIK
jgi:cell wall-associated NlpC family hydrolase